ncbi:MAG: hypothetical protein ACKPKO_54130, partial [Candidatus Fonsibacter sp.]
PKTKEADIVTAARKASQAAALAHSMSHSKTYEKLNVPRFPRSGDMTNWTYYLGIATVVAGGFGDEQEVKWLSECWSKSSELGGNPSDGWRWKRLDFSLSRALQGMIRSSGEP